MLLGFHSGKPCELSREPQSVPVRTAPSVAHGVLPMYCNVVAQEHFLQKVTTSHWGLLRAP